MNKFYKTLWKIKKFKCPFVSRKSYDALLKDYYRHEDHYWKQARLNFKAEDERVLEQLRKATQELSFKIMGLQ